MLDCFVQWPEVREWCNSYGCTVQEDKISWKELRVCLMFAFARILNYHIPDFIKKIYVSVVCVYALSNIYISIP